MQQFEDWGFFDFKISLKSSDVLITVAAYQELSRQTDYPLHLGVTEAGGLIAGTVKSALGIGMLLAEGIGDTMRVSLTRDPVEEVRVAYEILRALHLRERGVELISCPTCGRCRIDLFSLAEEAERRLLAVTTPLKVAIMGCVVNGPGRPGRRTWASPAAPEWGSCSKKAKWCVRCRRKNSSGPCSGSGGPHRRGGGTAGGGLVESRCPRRWSRSFAPPMIPIISS